MPTIGVLPLYPQTVIYTYSIVAFAKLYAC